MGKSFYFGTDAQLNTGAQAFSSQITASPSAFGLTTAQATTLAAAVTSYTTAYLVVENESTRTKGGVAAKNDARRVLRATIASLAKIIDGTPTVTDQQKINLGLSVRNPPSPIPVPTNIPNVEIGKRYGTTVFVRVHDGTARKTKPAGVQGVRLYSFVGPTPSNNPNDWVLEGQSTRSEIEVVFDSSLVPGTVVWFLAAWYNPRGQLGPASSPISTFLAGGSMNMAA